MGRVKRWWARRWTDLSQLQRVEFQYRVAIRAMSWIFLVSWAPVPLVHAMQGGPTTVALATVLAVLCLVTTAIGDQYLVPALETYLGRGRLSQRAVPLLGGLLTILLVLLGVLQAFGGLDGGPSALLVIFVTMPFSLVYCLVTPVRTFLVRQLAIAAAATAVFAAAGMTDLRLLAITGCALFGPLLAIVSARSGAWSVKAMVQAEQGREAQARLAVAEERLRFGRDLHDVMGRNLAVIALKSELAARLAARGGPAATEQMAEVQRIARDTQRELRDVVRGYREADLGAELAGAHGVLTAAGIDCILTGTATADALPGSTQSVLGWVVRETTTNVLRHGDPARCAITLLRDGGDAVLTVENDGAAEPAPAALKSPSGAPSGGSGLAGLRERLTAVSGTLEAQPVRDGLFRVTARVPLRGREPAPSDPLRASQAPDASTAGHGVAPAATAQDPDTAAQEPATAAHDPGAPRSEGRLG